MKASALGCLALVLVLVPAAAVGEPPAWTVTTPASIELAAGTPGTLQLDIAPGDRRTISRDGPVRVDIQVPAGVATRRRRLSLSDAVDPGAGAPSFSIKLTAEKAGSYDVELAVRFWVCSRQACKPVRTSRKVTVTVKA